MSAKPEIAVLTRIHAPALAALERDYIVHKVWAAPDRDARLREIGANVRAAVTTSLTGFRRSDFDALPKLELVACFGIGHVAIDLAAARERGVTVANTPDSIARSVADLAIGLMIAIMRRIPETDRFVRAGKWKHGLPPLGRELADKTCGIIGLGSIGRCIAVRAQAFGMAVRYHGPREKHDVAYSYCADVETLAAASDCLIVTCPATEATRGLVNARVLEALGPDGFLVNVARGAIVDENALVAALGESRIAGAALDVFWHEPDVPEPLLAMNNVVLVPHIGSSTLEVREQRSRHLLANLQAHFAGQPVPNRVQ